MNAETSDAVLTSVDIMTSAGILLIGGWVLLSVIAWLVIAFSRLLQRRIAHDRSGTVVEVSERIHGSVRRFIILLYVICVVVLLGSLAFSVWQARDPWAWLLDQLRSVPPERWISLGWICAKVIAASIGLAFALRLVRAGLRRLATFCLAWEDLKDNDQSLERFFTGLEHAVGTAAWLLFMVVAWHMLGGAELIGDGLRILTTVYLIISVGILIIRATAVVVDTAEGLSHRYAEKRGMIAIYEHMRPLVPLLRRCLEYALWIGIASLVIAQLPTVSFLAKFGPMAMKIIGIFFLGRVVIEFGNLWIGQGAEANDGMDDMSRRRKATIIPLTRSLFRVACYFVMFVLAVVAVGQDPLPYLASVGVLGMVVGFGAQSLVNDVVSGFFILFENVYLVGDVIEGGGAKGTVESIEFRTTRIRDTDGCLHIIRNGDMKQVVNFSREYTKAVVPFDVSYQIDVHKVFATLRACGEQVQQANSDVLEPLQIDGITGFGGSTMTVRTSMRVKPGRHESVAAELRLRLKEAFDQEALQDVPRKGLVPELSKP